MPRPSRRTLDKRIFLGETPKIVKGYGCIFQIRPCLQLPNVAAQCAKRPVGSSVARARGAMGRAADGDCLECRVIGTTVCVGACCPHHHPTPGRDPADVPVSPTPARFPRVRLIAQPPSLPLAGSSGAIAYELWSGAPRPPAHRYVMAAFAGGFLAMGVYRAVL